jgi:hypothetical protein
VADANAVDITSILSLVPPVGATGVLAWVAYRFGSGDWVPKSALVREQERADKLQVFVTDEVIPALTRATDAVRDATAEAAIRRRQ